MQVKWDESFTVDRPLYGVSKFDTQYYTVWWDGRRQREKREGRSRIHWLRKELV
jgi:hypothetical protein